MDFLKNLFKSTAPLNTKSLGEYLEVYHEFYMVCSGCDAAFPQDAIPICPYCHSYNFDATPRAVKAIAKKMQKPGYETYPLYLKELYKGR